VLKEFSATYRWYAVHCKPHREMAVAAHLQNQNFTVFLPKREATRRHARKVEKVMRPFFPGYLFIRLDVQRERWRSINSTFGVVHLVMQNESPAPAPFGVIETLMAACDCQHVLRVITPLKVGQKIRVIRGPLTDLVGELDQLSGLDRVRVLLDIMGGTRVVVPREYLIPADD
jgi:transcription elongation factor/antiterminator RfaH